MLRQLLLVAAGLMLALLPASAQQAPRRVALIIANATYAGYRPLPNTTVDAGLVEAALRRVGFEVQKQTDLGIGPMRTALGAFQSRAQGADVALVYYAGHGMEAGGKNWLIPTDARLATDAELDFQAIEANLVIRAAGGAKARIVVLDACRDNPFAARMRSTGAYRVTRTTGGGLSALDVQAARGTLLMYSAASGEVADDGAPGSGSPFARAFARYMPEPGVELRVAVGKVADAVFEETRERQLPFTTTSLSGSEIYLAGRSAVLASIDPELERLRRENETLRRSSAAPRPQPTSEPPSANERPSPAGPASSNPSTSGARVIPPPPGDAFSNRWTAFLTLQPLSRDSVANARLQRVGGRIARVAGVDPLKCAFAVTDETVVRASSMPPCRVAVTMGLLQVASRDDDLAFVVGHEFAHLMLGHSPSFRSVLPEYSQDLETDADYMGIDFMHRAAYDVTRSTTIISRLGATPQRVRDVERYVSSSYSTR